MDVLVCPVCASAKVGHDSLIVGRSGDAACANCGWKGKHKDLLVAQGTLTIGDASAALDIAREVSTTYMHLLAEHAGLLIGACIMRSGIIGAKDTQSLARLIKAACTGAHKATLDEVENIQKELQDAKRSNAE